MPAESQRDFAHDFARVRVHSQDHGDPLPGELRARTQAQLGHDFSGVRLHTGPDAAQAAREVAATAFTTGEDIFLGADADRPGSGAGDRLLVHELVHVVQQREASRVADGVSAPGDAAERAAHAVAAGGPLVRAGGTVAALQRQATTGGEKRPVKRDKVKAALTDWLKKGMQERGDTELHITEQVKRGVRRLFKDIPQGTMMVDYVLEHSKEGDPAKFAAQVAEHLPDEIPADNLDALQHTPVKEAPGRPKTLGEKVRAKAKEELGKIGQPPQKGTGSPSERALPPSPPPAPTAQAPGTHTGSSPPFPWEFPVGKPQPKPAGPQAGSDPLASARIDPNALTPADARGTPRAADFPDASEFARDVARKLDAAQKAKNSTLYLDLGRAYANVKDRTAIYESAWQIILSVRDAMPDKASGVTEIVLRANGQVVRQLKSPPSPE